MIPHRWVGLSRSSTGLQRASYLTRRSEEEVTRKWGQLAAISVMMMVVLVEAAAVVYAEEEEEEAEEEEEVVAR